MNYEILELDEKLLERYDVKKFVFKMIKDSYGLDYVPEYHYDVVGMEEYYINPERSNFFIAVSEDDKLIGTAAIRGYDKNYIIKDRTYTIECTASIYRLFVDSEYRHNKIASNMLKSIEDFCDEQKYNEIYLHTQRDSYGALAFWLNRGYVIVQDTHDEMGTIHMEKVLKNSNLLKSKSEETEKIEIL